MRRPSRSPSFKRTPWVWSHGDGPGYCADPNATPYGEQLTEDDYDRATSDEISRSYLIWQHLSPLHPLMQLNRDWQAGKPAIPKSEEDNQQ
eukprot:5214329-Pyramimonas_sp.AAC.1